TLRFFHFSHRQAQQFTRGKSVRAYGEVRPGPSGLEMVHPQYRLFDGGRRPPLDETLTPVYPSTEGVGQTTWRKLTDQALSLLQQYPLPELLPPALLADIQLPALNDALRTVHRPQPDDDLDALMEQRHPAQQRLIIEELIAHQLGLAQLRAQKRALKAPPLPPSQLVNALLASLPFTLTEAQQRVLAEVQADLQRNHPMQRLVQGDVGSGKTIIAALAALQAADAGFQAAVMAPTEILAEQHRNHFMEWLAPLDVSVAWLNGRLKAAERREQLERITSGEAQVVIGTHALFQQEVSFHKLGLAIIDEQHRFGVHQRLALHRKGLEAGLHPHQLIMTATPIPRTLAMAAYGDLDVSIIDQLPPGRKPVKTAVMSMAKRNEVMAHLAQRCREGVQAYWVCPLIEESEALDAQAAEATAALFRERFADLRVGLVHGRMKPAEKDAIMQRFKAGDLDVLVATTVIEVGVNVPNASLMIIENAERLGLAQLHQLRGRVGRGAKQSHCVLLYQPPLSESARRRLQVMRETTDGFAIAEEDLKIRGPGEVLGTRQTGGLQFRLAQLPRDEPLLPIARQWAHTILQDYPEQATALRQRWLGQKEDYALA
ncbi:ATP-dependent DNA helicase RecG, partial [Sulfurivirga sp.]|uniref:ATP-dependent DNA helicase RecG n=1 Tax=Sulfurivirga sp. TaxID=2614236 RepID=UPI0025FF989E